MIFWRDFLSYITLIGFANCILYGGHRLIFGVEPNAAVIGLRTYDYFLYFHVLMDSRLVSGRSCSKKVRYCLLIFPQTANAIGVLAVINWFRELAGSFSGFPLAPFMAKVILRIFENSQMFQNFRNSQTVPNFQILKILKNQGGMIKKIKGPWLKKSRGLD